jgi:putative tryptophan/tyrosine transport system substrate-binding protein
MNTTRRTVVAALVLLGALPGMARAQRQPRTIAWFGIGGPDDFLPYLNGLQTGLKDSGWEEGRNLKILRFASVKAPDDFEQVVREILDAKPEVVVTHEFATLGMLRFSKGVPVVFGFSGDPVEAKLVKSLARPETSFTGITYLASALVGKRIEFLKEALPGIQRIGILARPQHPGEHLERTASEEAAAKLGLSVSYFPITAVAQIEPAFAGMREAKCDALVVFPDAIMYRNRELISQLAAVARLPAVSGWSSFADSGLLFNYGPNLREIYVRLASYVDRILRGTPPGELPVDLPRSIELVVNLRTARALGFKISQSVLVRADRVIE